VPNSPAQSNLFGVSPYDLPEKSKNRPNPGAANLVRSLRKTGQIAISGQNMAKYPVQDRKYG
jgi:hypothetical protein